MLIADRDRDRVIERLRRAAGEGRLTVAELEERFDRAVTARTNEDLKPLVRDLPAPRRRDKSALFGPVLAALIVVSVFLNGIPVWLLAMPLAFGGCRSPRRFT